MYSCKHWEYKEETVLLESSWEHGSQAPFSFVRVHFITTITGSFISWVSKITWLEVCSRYQYLQLIVWVTIDRLHFVCFCLPGFMLLSALLWRGTRFSGHGYHGLQQIVEKFVITNFSVPSVCVPIFSGFLLPKLWTFRYMITCVPN